jgi:hypothetical protein
MLKKNLKKHDQLTIKGNPKECGNQGCGSRRAKMTKKK